MSETGYLCRSDHPGCGQYSLNVYIVPRRAIAVAWTKSNHVLQQHIYGNSSMVRYRAITLLDGPLLVKAVSVCRNWGTRWNNNTISDDCGNYSALAMESYAKLLTFTTFWGRFGWFCHWYLELPNLACNIIVTGEDDSKVTKSLDNLAQVILYWCTCLFYSFIPDRK